MRLMFVTPELVAFMARAVPLTPVTALGPTGCQFVPSKRAMRLSGDAPEAVKSPAAYVLPLKRSMARTVALNPGPIADHEPGVNAVWLHAAMRLAAIPPAAVNSPPAMRFRDWSGPDPAA